MHVLVTGGAGYIGSVLTRMLLDKGYDVTVLDRFFFGRDSLKDIADRIDVVKDDIRWFHPSILNGVDAVIDMAALSNDPTGELDQSKTLDINYLGRVRMAKLAKEHGVKRYLLASSCSIYGYQDSIVDETSPTKPLTTYAKANILWEKDTLPLNDKNFTVTALRQSTIYGLSHKMRFDLAVNGMVLGFHDNSRIPIMRDGTQWRPFVHVKDTSAAFIAAMETDPEIVGGQIFNVGSEDQNYQILPLAMEVAEAMGVPFEYEWYGSPDHRSYRVSFEKIKNVLGFQPKYRPKDGAKEVADALRAGSLKGDDPRYKTLDWYKHLLLVNSLLGDIKIKDTIL